MASMRSRAAVWFAPAPLAAIFRAADLLRADIPSFVPRAFAADNPGFGSRRDHGAFFLGQRTETCKRR